MKKFLLVLAIGAFVACNDEGTTDSTTVDSTTTTIDSTTITVDTTNRSSVDTTKADTTLRK